MLYKERLLFKARFREINSGVLLSMAKTREHTAYDYDFQEMTMTFRKWLCLSGNVRKCQQISGNACNFLKSTPKLGFSGDSENAPILRSRLKVLGADYTGSPLLFPVPGTRYQVHGTWCKGTVKYVYAWWPTYVRIFPCRERSKFMLNKYETTRRGRLHGNTRMSQRNTECTADF